MQHNTHKQPFVHLAYRKIMIDHLPLRDLCQQSQGRSSRAGRSGQSLLQWHGQGPQGHPG